MELGNQIKALRLERGVTQETVATALGVSAQAVSKWETGAAAPDIALLPAISAYFGVSIDELFALSDETKLERIQNMLWNQREIGRADADSAARTFARFRKCKEVYARLFQSGCPLARLTVAARPA